MKTKIYYLLLLVMMILMSSCGKSPRTETDSVLEYDIIDIDSCEYIMVQSRTYYGYIVTSIGHKGNCKYCMERNDTELKLKVDNEVEHKNVTDTLIIYKYIE